MLTKLASPFLIFFFTLSLLPQSSFSQRVKSNFFKVDAYAKSVKGLTDIGKLSNKLTAPYDTDLEKVRSIFRWITENIAYDTKEYHVNNKEGSEYSKLFSNLKSDAKNSDQLYDLEIAKYVLKNKKGICSGYAALFKSLCDSSNLKAEIVNGMAKNSVTQIGTAMESNHAWNAVFIDNKWQLLDATWSSGVCDDSVKKFTKKYDDSYFLTPPNKFYLNHCPTDKRWILFSNPPAETQFYSYPLLYSGFFKNEIISFSPMNGIIEGKIGNKITFEIRTPDDESSVSVGTNKGNNEVKIKRQEKIITYEYTVTSDKEDVLTIYFNREAVLAYRIIVVP